MSVVHICTKEVDLAKPGETVQVAAHRMFDRNAHTLVVLDEDRRPIGILTDRDLAVRVVAHRRDAGTTLVSEVMTRHVFTVDEAASVEKALSQMRAHQVKRLLVIDLDGRLVGLLSLDEVLEFLAKEFRIIRQLIDRDGPHGLAR
jgi:CBS domain-containing protein